MKFSLTTFMLAIILVANAQQDRQLSFYSFDGMSFNPAITGFEGYSGTMIYRNQWDKVENAPNTTLFNFQGNLNNIISNRLPGAVGVGLSFYNDVIGQMKQNNFKLNGAYHIKTPVGKFSAGFGLGFLQMVIDGEWIAPDTPVLFDPTISGLMNKVGESRFDLNFGLHYANRYGYVGFSTTHMSQSAFQQLSMESARHYYVLAGTSFGVGAGQRFKLKPSVLIKADGAIAIFDLNVRAEHALANNRSVWIGTTYRFSDGLGLMAGTSMGGLHLGYSFEWMTNPMKVWGRGSHEFMLRYEIFPAPKPITGTSCPHILY